MYLILPPFTKISEKLLTKIHFHDRRLSDGKIKKRKKNGPLKNKQVVFQKKKKKEKIYQSFNINHSILVILRGFDVFVQHFLFFLSIATPNLTKRRKKTREERRGEGDVFENNKIMEAHTVRFSRRPRSQESERRKRGLPCVQARQWFNNGPYTTSYCAGVPHKILIAFYRCFPIRPIRGGRLPGSQALAN